MQDVRHEESPTRLADVPCRQTILDARQGLLTFDNGGVRQHPWYEGARIECRERMDA
jgi:hypothetical protein